MKKRFLLVFVVLLLCVASCYKAPVDEYVPVADVSLNHSSFELDERETVQLQATVSPDNASVKQVKWESSHHKVATVTETGVVTAVGEGTTVVTASAGGKSARCQITVRKAVVAVGRVSLDKKTLELEKGLSEILEATIEPDNATDKTIHWSTSDVNVADVDRNGKVTAIGGGAATITAAAGDCEAQCEVIVTVPAAEIAISAQNLTLEPGQRAALEAEVLPDDATDKTVVWSSDAIQVATVGQDGTVTAIGEGTCQITATSGGCSASCNISVSKGIIKVESISLDKTTLSLAIGSGETITATVLPVDATDRRVFWASTNSAIADVDDYGYVTARSSGSVTITATTSDQELVAACEVTAYVPYVPVTGINLDKSSVELLQGQSQKLIATVRPADATEKAVKWTTSDAAVASVSNDGVITAVGEGTATITATAGEMSAECIVTVTIPEVPVIQVERVILDRQELTLDAGQSATLSATVYPDDATDKTVVWTSDNGQVATVSQTGMVEAIAEGTARVTATSGDRSATCTVTVNKPIVSVTGVALSQTQLSLEVEGYAQLIATVSPTDATDKTVRWSSSNVAVAEVDDFGTVVARALGEATITVTTSDGSFTATCLVTVSEPEVPPVDPPQPPEPEEHPYTSNVSWSLGNRAYDHTTGGEYPGQTAVINTISVDQMVKLGTGSGGGEFTIIIPSGTTYIGFFALGWKGSTPKLNITCAGKSTTIDIKPNNGVAQTPPYTISTTEEEAYHTYVVPSTTATTVTMASEGRVVIWGINYYTGEAPGGDTPGGDTPGGGDPPEGDDDPVFTGWMELPAIDNPNLKFVTHESSVNPSGRNYSLYWDSSALVAHWVAYPMNADIIGSGSRTDQWGYDPKLDPSEQPLLKKAYTGSWDRGHQIASADRLRRADNIQTFYYTNMTPQNGSFNGGIWNTLENKVRAWSKQLDTLYVVSGCVIEGSTTYAKDNNGRNVTVPVAYYKALLGFDKSKKAGITSQTSGYTGIAFYFDHHGDYSSSSYMNYSMTIDALEAKVGVDFFVNLPPAIGEDKANKVESTRDNWWSK